MPQNYFEVEALSNSGIKELLVTPEHYRTWKDTPKEESSAMRVGSRLHEVMLEGLPLNRIPVFFETKTFDSKAGRIYLEENPKALTVEEFDKVSAMAGQLKKNSRVMEMLSVCTTEVEVYGHAETSFGPIQKKAKLDGFNPVLLFDLKTTGDRAADFRQNNKKKKLQYEVQAAWYTHMCQRYIFQDDRELAFFFIVVESKPPYGVKIWPAGKKFIEEGMQKCVRAVEIYGQCVNTGIWPGYNNDDDALEEL